MYQSRKLALAALAAIGILPVGLASAQYYGAAQPPQAPLYPYSVSAPVQQDYERYLRSRQQSTRRSHDDQPVASIRTRKSYSRDTASQRELIEELRRRPGMKRITINTKPIIVNEPPVVIERYRKGKPVTKVIETYNEVDAPRMIRRKDKREAGGDVRIIRAEAEVRIIGKDQMSIKLYRKGGVPSAAVD